MPLCLFSHGQAALLYCECIYMVWDDGRTRCETTQQQEGGIKHPRWATRSGLCWGGVGRVSEMQRVVGRCSTLLVAMHLLYGAVQRYCCAALLHAARLPIYEYLSRMLPVGRVEEKMHLFCALNGGN